MKKRKKPTPKVTNVEDVVVAAVVKDVAKDVEIIEVAIDNATMIMMRDKTEMKEAKEASEEEVEVAQEAAVEAKEGVPEEPKEAAVEATKTRETTKTITKANVT